MGQNTVDNKLSGIIFWQGDSDAINYSDAIRWSWRFSQLKNSFESNFGIIPIIVVQLGNHGDDATYPYYDLIRSQQENIVGDCLGTVSTYDIQQNGLHYYLDGYDIIGERIAETYDLIDCP